MSKVGFGKLFPSLLAPRVLGSAAVAVAMFSAIAGVQAKPRFVTFMVDGLHTLPTGINEKGAVTGVFLSSLPEGFVRLPDGTVSQFKVPQSTLGTYPTSINKKGEITGYYIARNNDGVGIVHGFLRRPDGSIKTFKVPNDKGGAYPVTVNSQGAIFGTILHGHNGHSGFIREKDGTVTEFDCSCDRTFLTGGNDLGAATGYGSGLAYIRNSDGAFVNFVAGNSTTPVGINDEGLVAGSIGEETNRQGFVRASDGTITIFDAPEAALGTIPAGINADGAIAGSFLDSAATTHGFVRAVDGTMTVFDPENSTMTQTAGINAKGAITGYYKDENGIVIGFIRTP